MLVLWPPSVTDKGVSLGDHDSLSVALGDLDAFVANYAQGNRVWINTNGDFSNGQSLGTYNSFGASLGDLDGDGDLDAFAANGYRDGNRVWLNEDGQFTASGQSLGDNNSTSGSLGDLDGDLDAFVTSFQITNRVWLNADLPARSRM